MSYTHLTKTELVFIEEYHAFKPAGRRASDIETTLNHWLNPLPKHLFKSIIFDCGKEFSNWKAISNQYDIDIYFILSQNTVSKKAK